MEYEDRFSDLEYDDEYEFDDGEGKDYTVTGCGEDEYLDDYIAGNDYFDDYDF